METEAHYQEYYDDGDEELIDADLDDIEQFRRLLLEAEL